MKLCLYGAGNAGKKFIFNNGNQYLNLYNEIFFADNNQDLWNSQFCGYSVKDDSFIDENTDVIITSNNFWAEIYKECLLTKKKIIGIYDEQTNKLMSYKEICNLKKTGFMNEGYFNYIKNKEEKMSENISNFLLSDNLFDNINEVNIMLSNLCNYAHIHKKCPAHFIKNKEILPSEIVHKIIDELANNSFQGTISFHVYNEPLIDPRLFWFIEYAKKRIPNSKIEIYSNGYYLDNQMINELENIGTDILIVTGYGDLEYNRLINLEVDICYNILYGNLDERIDNYKEREHPVSTEKCCTYFRQIPIYSNGDLGTCCLDYLHTYTLGNIFENSLKYILNSEKTILFQKELLQGNRSRFGICKNCRWKR